MNNRLFNFRLENLQRFRLANGLTVITCKDTTIPVVTCITWYRAGSRNDPVGSAGTAHFLEHMMFKGTKRFKKGEIDNITAQFGGFNNGFTSYDFTAFCFSFASDHWWPALEIESERMKNNLFIPQEFKLEQQVILEELKMEMDDPWESLRDAISREVFPNHPYRFPVAGTIRDVERLEMNQVIDFYESYYIPNNAVITLVGDIDSERAKHEIEKQFGHFSSVPLPEQDDFGDPYFGGTAHLKICKPSPISRMALALPAPAFSAEEFVTLEVLDQILTGGKLARLYRRLVEENQYATLLSSEYAESLDPYLYTLRMELRGAVEFERVEDIVFDELDRLIGSEISTEELDRARIRSMVQFVGDLETTLDLAFQIGILEILNEGDLIQQYSTLLQNVSTDKIANLIRNYFNREKVTTAVLPRKDGCC